MIELKNVEWNLWNELILLKLGNERMDLRLSTFFCIFWVVFGSICGIFWRKDVGNFGDAISLTRNDFISTIDCDCQRLFIYLWSISLDQMQIFFQNFNSTNSDLCSCHFGSWTLYGGSYVFSILKKKRISIELLFFFLA